MTQQPGWEAVLQHMRDRHPVVTGPAWHLADEAIGFTGTCSGPAFQAALERSDGYMLFLHQATHAIQACDHPPEEVPLELPNGGRHRPPAD